MPMCRIFACVVQRGCLLRSVCSLDKTLLVFALLHFVLQGQTWLLYKVSLDFTLLRSNPLWWEGHLFLVLVLEGLVGLHRTSTLQFLQHQWLQNRLGLLWYWMVCIGKKPKSFCHFWGCTQVLHLCSFVDYEGYFISSKEFLPTVLDTMVIWIKFTHSHSF